MSTQSHLKKRKLGSKHSSGRTSRQEPDLVSGCYETVINMAQPSPQMYKNSTVCTEVIDQRSRHSAENSSQPPSPVRRTVELHKAYKITADASQNFLQNYNDYSKEDESTSRIEHLGANTDYNNGTSISNNVNNTP